jgi:O-methyltransferase
MAETGLVDRYLSLVVEAVNGSLYGAQPHLAPLQKPTRAWEALSRLADRRGVELATRRTVPARAYDTGEGWQAGHFHQGYSMVGRARLQNVRHCVETVLSEDVPGDLIETGVWRGGAAIVMKAVVAAHGADRRVVAADSFEGLPPTDLDDDAGHLHLDRSLAVSVDDVAAAFAAFDLLDDGVEFLKGWFSDTLPGLAGRTWAVIRLDGDMYESTMDGITNLYPGLSPGGFLIVDDYGTYTSCRRAIDEYRDTLGITDAIVPIDANGVYWRKGA